MTIKTADSRALPPIKSLTLAILAALAATPTLIRATTPLVPGQALDASEFLVNASLTTLGQFTPKVARDATGDFVVVWQGYEFIGAQLFNEIFARRYNAAGQPQGSAFLVNTNTTANVSSPAVAMDAAGDFVVTWMSSNQAATNSGLDIYARQYQANGSAAQTSEFLVNTTTSSGQGNPAVAMDAAGDFVVAWRSYNQAASNSGWDIYARQYQANGTAMQASEFLVNTVTSSLQATPAVAMDAAGDFVVAWQSVNQAAPTSGNDIYARQYHSNGTAVQATEFLANTFTVGFQDAPAVAMDAAGDFVVAWESENQAATGSNFDIYARQYHSNGTAVQASEFLVNTYISDYQMFPSVAMDAVGNFVMTWESWNQAATNSIFDIYARHYQADGSAVQASDFLVNVFTVSNGDQQYPAAAMDAAGDYVVAYAHRAYSSGDYFYGIYARRYQGLERVDLKAGITASPALATPGSSVSLTASLDNNTAPFTLVPPSVPGGSLINAALGIPTLPQAAITLPAGANFTGVAGGNWTCPGAPTGGVFTCSYTASLAPGGTATPLTVNVAAPNSAGNINFTNAVSSLEQDGNPADNTASATVSVTVAGNVAPVASNGAVSTNKNTAVPGTLAASDADGDTLTFAVVGNPSHGTVVITNAATGAFSYTPASGYSGSDTFTFHATDSVGHVSNTATESVTVAVVANAAPVASNGAVSTSQNTAVSGTLAASDSDGDALTFAVVGNPSHGTVTITNASTGVFSYTPSSGYSGSDSFSFRAADSVGNLSNTAAESVTVTASSGGGSGGGYGGGGGLGLLSLLALGLPWLRKRRN